MKKTTIIIALSIISIGGYAQTKFTKATADASKIKVALDFPGEGRNSDNGKGYSANVELLNPKPKKIALISYYLYDPAQSDNSTTSAKIWVTAPTAGQIQVNAIYNESIDDLKKGFKEYDIDLLTPEEFLDTEEKKKIYKEFEPESSKKEKTSRSASIKRSTTLTGAAGASINTLKIAPSSANYRTFFAANEEVNNSSPKIYSGGILGANRQLTSSLGHDLAKKLGVDAVAIVYIVSRQEKSGKGNYAVNAAHLLVYGPNPKSEGPDDANRGQFYSGARVFYNNGKRYQEHKEGIAEYQGFSNVMYAMAKKSGNWIINKEKK